MIEIALNQAVITIIGFFLTGVLGFLVGRLKKITGDRKSEKENDKKIQKARIIIEKASARAHIKEAYQKYVIEGQHMTIAAYEELLEEYEAYLILGGNGTAKAYMKEIIENVKPYLVTD